MLNVINVISNKEHAGLLDTFVLASICGTGLLLTSKRKYLLSNHLKKNGMEFLTDPDKDSRLKEFITGLKANRDKYLIEKYGQINKNLPYNDHYDNLVWLKTIEALSEPDYLLKLKQLDLAFIAPKKVMGFGQQNTEV